MTDDLDDRLAARFARQDDPRLQPGLAFDPVRSRAEQLERSRQRRHRMLLIAAVVAALVAVPAIAVSRTLVERVFGQPAEPGLRDYIGLVLHTRPDAFESVERAAGEAQRRGVDTGAGKLCLGVRDEGIQLGVLLVAGAVGATLGDSPDARSRMPAGSWLTRDGRGSSCAATRVPRRPSLMTKPRSRSER